ncbi:hypothetical protein KM043_008666 [Ampulex compressa]|nr:hypothetical protein KM043_008666 [Ampulex compressa]
MGKGATGVRLAALAGVFATSGSFFGKLAGGVAVHDLVSLLAKAILIVIMITCNTVGCMFFVKGLNASGSSLPSTIASTATSYVCSALVGCLVFGESTSIVWWCGTFLVLLGVLFICYVPPERNSAVTEEKLKQS